MKLHGDKHAQLSQWIVTELMEIMGNNGKMAETMMKKQSDNKQR